MSVPTLAGITLLQTTFGEFLRPEVKQVIPILGDGTTNTGNAVLQGGAPGFLQASLSFFLDDRADVTTLRDLAETADAATYVDHEGETWIVRLLALQASLDGNSMLWACSLTLVVVEQHYS